MFERVPPGQGSPAIVAGIQWLQDLMLGPVATSVAMICVAGLGYQLLLGRIPARRAATAILGCCILLGAPGIVVALRGASVAEQPPGTSDREPAVSPIPLPRRAPQPAPDPFNPYGSR